MGWPERTSAVAPFSTSLTPCRSISSFWAPGDVLTTFRMTSPVPSTRLAAAKTGPSGAAGGLVPSLTSLSSRKQRTFLPSTSTRMSYQRPVSTVTGAPLSGDSFFPSRTNSSAARVLSDPPTFHTV